MVQNIDLPQGPLLLLRILTLHGGRSRSERSRFRTTCCKFDKAQRIRRCTDWTANGWIKARWGASGNNRRAKFYELTKAGREQLEREKDAWDELTRAVAPVLRTA